MFVVHFEYRRSVLLTTSASDSRHRINCLFQLLCLLIAHDLVWCLLFILFVHPRLYGDSLFYVLIRGVSWFGVYQLPPTCGFIARGASVWVCATSQRFVCRFCVLSNSSLLHSLCVRWALVQSSFELLHLCRLCVLAFNLLHTVDSLHLVSFVLFLQFLCSFLTCRWLFQLVKVCRSFLNWLCIALNFFLNDGHICFLSSFLCRLICFAVFWFDHRQICGLAPFRWAFVSYFLNSLHTCSWLCSAGAGLQNVLCCVGLNDTVTCSEILTQFTLCHDFTFWLAHFVLFRVALFLGPRFLWLERSSKAFFCIVLCLLQISRLK